MGWLRTLAAAVLVAVIVIAFAVGVVSARRYESLLSGYWVGDPGFLERARLQDMQLFVAPPEGGRRRGYLIMTDLGGDFVANGAVEIRGRAGPPRWWAALGPALRASRDAYRRGAALEGAPFPAEVRLTVSALDGTLTISDDEKVYAFLARDGATSGAALEAWAAGGGDSAPIEE